MHFGNFRGHAYKRQGRNVVADMWWWWWWWQWSRSLNYWRSYLCNVNGIRNPPIHLMIRLRSRLILYWKVENFLLFFND